MKQKIVIRVRMPCNESRSKATALVARAYGLISMVVTGDSKDLLEVIGEGVDPVRLVSCLRKKLGDADILLVEEVKDKEKKPEEEKKPGEATAQPMVMHPLPQWYPGYYHHPPSTTILYDEPNNCSMM